MVLAIMLSVLLVWALYEVDKRYFGEVDSMVAASIRAATIFVFPITIWFAWYSYRKRSGAVFTVARCMRGLLASNLSPIWVSWLYAGKRYPAKVDAVQPTDRTLKQVAVDNWLLPVLFVICLVLFSNTQWLEGQFNVDPVPDNRRGKAHWVNYVVQWLFQHPTSTLFIAAPLGSLSIAGFAFKLLKVAIPKLAGRIAMAIFFLSLLLFATRSLA